MGSEFLLPMWVASAWPALYAGKLLRDAARWVRRCRSEELRALDMIVTGMCVRKNPESSREALMLVAEMTIQANQIRARKWRRH